MMPTVEQMIETAFKLVGQPYLWGGNGETLEDIIRVYADSKGQGKSATSDMIKFVSTMILIPLSTIHFQDCSGLIVEVLRKIGAVSKSWDESAEGIYKKCTKVDKPCKGAFAFFYNGKKHNHVGICVDETTVIHSYSVNTGVIVEPIANKKGKWVDFGLPKWCIDFNIDTITLVKDVYVYRTAREAKEKPETAQKTLYKKGIYYTFRTYEDCTNITKEQESAGGWIYNPDLYDAMI